jgi:hypothetical protein
VGKLTPEAEERLIEQLISIEWVRDLDSLSCEIVSRVCYCSLEEATDILQGLVDRRLIERVGVHPRPSERFDSFRCAWVKGSGS